MKSIAEPVTNTSTYERSVLGGLIHAQARQLQEEGLCHGGLVGPSASMGALRVADQATYSGAHIAVGDTVLSVASTGHVLACAREDDDLFIVVRALGLQERVSEHSCL